MIISVKDLSQNVEENSNKITVVSEYHRNTCMHTHDNYISILPESIGEGVNFWLN